MPLQYASLQEAWGRDKKPLSSSEFFEGVREASDNLQSTLLQLYHRDGAAAVIDMLPLPLQHVCRQRPVDMLDKVILMLLGGFLALVILDLRVLSRIQAPAVRL